MERIVIERRKNQNSPDDYLFHFLENWFPDEVDEFVIDGQHNEDDLEDYIPLLRNIEHKVTKRICLNGFNIKSKDFWTLMSAFWYCESIGFRASNWDNCGTNFLIQDDTKFEINKIHLDYPIDLTSDSFNTMINSLVQNQHFRDNIEKVVIAKMKFKNYPKEKIGKYNEDPSFELIIG